MPKTWRHYFGAAFYVVPVLTLLVLLAYGTLALAWQVNPPFLGVRGTTMEPVFHTGDLVLLHHVDPDQLRTGDLVSVTVPRTDRRRYGLARQEADRVVGLRHLKGGGLRVSLMGRNEQAPDPFSVPAVQVQGEVAGTIPYLGWLVLFFESGPVDVFLVSLILLLVVLGSLVHLERRHEEGVIVRRRSLSEL